MYKTLNPPIDLGVKGQTVVEFTSLRRRHGNRRRRATRRRRGRGSSGFPLSRVLSDNVDEFTCKICADFAESPVVTLCANKHVFCKACLEEWFLSSNALSCPSCQEKAPYGTDARFESLKEHSPVLSRVYEKVRVRCPMEGCDGSGRYRRLRCT